MNRFSQNSVKRLHMGHGRIKPLDLGEKSGSRYVRVVVMVGFGLRLGGAPSYSIWEDVLPGVCSI